MKNAVIGFIHPKSIKFFDEYLNSMDIQSFKDFNLIIFLDRVDLCEIQYIINNCDKLNIICRQLDSDLSIPKAREAALEYLKDNNYDTCIFTDTDDFFHKDYVSELIRSLSENNNIVFCDVSIYFSDTNILTNYFGRYGVPEEIDLQYICEKNCIGLGNSGIRLSLYEKDEFHFPDDIIAVDWWFYSVLMKKKGCKAYFINKPLVFYRQYDSNTAGFLNLDDNKIINGIKVKILHYKNLVTFDKQFSKKYDDYKALCNKIANDIEYKRYYIDNIRSIYKRRLYLWWEFAQQID